MIQQKYLKYRTKYLNLKNELSGGYDPIDPIDSIDPLILQSVRQLFEKYSEIRYQNKTLYEIEEKIWTTYTLNQILLRTIPNNTPYPDKVIDQQNLIRFGADINHIDDRAFQDNQLTDIRIPSTIRTIGANAFAFNRLTDVRIPETVINIGDYAFSHNQLVQMTIPDSVRTIGTNAFRNNLVQLREVTLPRRFIDSRREIFGPNYGNIIFTYTD
jgi:hypothetical protein